MPSSRSLQTAILLLCFATASADWTIDDGAPEDSLQALMAAAHAGTPTRVSVDHTAPGTAKAKGQIKDQESRQHAISVTNRDTFRETVHDDFKIKITI